MDRARAWLAKPGSLVKVVVVALALGVGSWAYVATRPAISCSSNLLDTKASMTKDECQVLADFYEQNVEWDQSPLPEERDYVPRTFLNWRAEPNPCLWHGVQCSAGHLTELSVERLTTYDRTVLPPELGDLTHLTRLHIEATLFADVPKELGKLTNLTSLSLVRAYEVPSHTPATFAEIFREMTNLEELSVILFRLPEPLLEDVPAAVKGLPHLTKLALPSADEIPPEVFELTNLTSLHLVGSIKGWPSLDRHGKLDRVPAGLTKLTNLKDLNLRGNSIKTLPADTAQLRKLTTLDLSDNKFTKLPSELRQLPQLRTLSLEQNKLSAVAPHISELASLRSLDLSFNRITKLPVEIAQVRQLQRLNVERNELTDLPAELAQLPHLTDLAIGWNKFKEQIPAVVFGINPVKLSLVGLGLTKLSLKDGQLSRVVDLDLSHNLWEAFPMEVARLPNLARLNVSETRLLALPTDMSSLAHLEFLDLSNDYKIRDGSPLDPLLRVPGYEHRFDLSKTCLTSDNPKLQKLIQERRWQRDALTCRDFNGE